MKGEEGELETSVTLYVTVAFLSLPSGQGPGLGDLIPSETAMVQGMWWGHIPCLSLCRCVFDVMWAVTCVYVRMYIWGDGGVLI